MASAVGSDESSGFVDDWQSGKSLAECNLHMLTSEDSCDVTFRVGKDENIVRAHRYILISRSCVFHAMFCGPLSEKEDIKIPDADEEIFSEMIKFLYTNDATLTPDNVTGLLYLSKKYAIAVLERLCLTYLETSLSPDNACIILEQAHGFDEKELHNKAIKVILTNGENCITKPGFKDLCHDCFEKVIQSEHLIAKAESVFKAVLTWTEAECERRGQNATPENERNVLGDALFDLPFTQMGAEVFARFVVPSRILSGDECTKLFCFFSLPYSDATPFKIKPRRIIFDDIQAYHECSLYREVMSLLQPTQLFSSVILEAGNADVHLTGFKAFGSYTCCIYKYDIELQIELHAVLGFTTQQNFENVPGTVSDTGEVELRLPEPCLLRASGRYRVLVKTVLGESRKFGTKLKTNLNFGRCRMTCHHSTLDQERTGLLSKIIFGEI